MLQTIERFLDHNGYLVRMVAAPSSDEAVLFLHGFPGNMYVRNLDLALYLREALNLDTFLTHYRGLGEHPGEFLFTTSLQDTAALVKWLVQKKGYKKIHLVGHSWGGLVATHCAIAHPNLIGSVIFLSPFCFIEKGEPLYEWFTETIRTECPGIFGSHARTAVQSDFDQIIAHDLPVDRAVDVSDRIRTAIIQAKNDEVTWPKFARQVAERLKRPPIYIELDQDHGFLKDRLELAQTVVRVFQELNHKK